jgi:NAD-dependent dihydropyrimidine dehydrogenase PreA subunit
LIAINTERCNGCGACVDACPNGALYLVDGQATVDSTLCYDCEACIAACPTEAITIAEGMQDPATGAPRMPVSQPASHIIRVDTLNHPVPVRPRILPMAGAALIWAGREIVPWLAQNILDALDRRSPTQVAENVSQDSSVSPVRAAGGGGSRRRRRRGRRR